MSLCVTGSEADEDEHAEHDVADVVAALRRGAAVGQVALQHDEEGEQRSELQQVADDHPPDVELRRRLDQPARRREAVELVVEAVLEELDEQPGQEEREAGLGVEAVEAEALGEGRGLRSQDGLAERRGAAAAAGHRARTCSRSVSQIGKALRPIVAMQRASQPLATAAAPPPSPSLDAALPSRCCSESEPSPAAAAGSSDSSELRRLILRASSPAARSPAPTLPHLGGVTPRLVLLLRPALVVLPRRSPPPTLHRRSARKLCSQRALALGSYP